MYALHASKSTDVSQDIRPYLQNLVIAFRLSESLYRLLHTPVRCLPIVSMNTGKYFVDLKFINYILTRGVPII